MNLVIGSAFANLTFKTILRNTPLKYAQVVIVKMYTHIKKIWLIKS